MIDFSDFSECKKVFDFFADIAAIPHGSGNTEKIADYLESFAKQLYTWCDSNGVKLTGHYVEERTIGGQMMCCAGIMPFYE